MNEEERRLYELTYGYRPIATTGLLQPYTALTNLTKRRSSMKKYKRRKKY